MLVAIDLFDSKMNRSDMNDFAETICLLKHERLLPAPNVSHLFLRNFHFTPKRSSKYFLFSSDLMNHGDEVTSVCLHGHKRSH